MEEAGFGLNTDILETNLINILLLIGLLFISFADTVKTGLKDREAEILANLDSAANKLIGANYSYKESLAKFVYLKTKAIEVQEEKLVQLRNIREQSVKQFEPYLDNEIEAVKKISLGQYSSFDVALISGIFQVYKDYAKTKKK